MSNPDSDKSKSNSGNSPRLKAFLRQARAVIAAERGLNPRSQMKLQSLAQSLKLPAELFQTALDELKHAQKPTEVAHWERGFVDFLDKEFKKLPDQIVSIRMETRAVDLAMRKYQLSEIRARQLIAQRAEALGLGRIAPREARQYIKQLIIERVGDATALSDEIREQLYQTGHSWGLERSVVDELVLDQLIRNRGFGRSRAGVWLLLFLITLGAVGYAGYKFSWLEKIEHVIAKQRMVVAPVDPIDGLLPQPAPRRVDWWSEDFQAEIELLTARQPELKFAISKTAEPLPVERTKGFRKLIDLIIKSDDSQKTAPWETWFCKLFFLEPDSVTADSCLDYLGEYLQPGSADGPISFARFQLAYRANELFSQLAVFEPAVSEESTENRKQDALKKQSTILGLAMSNTMDADALQRETKSALALEQWDSVLQNCWSTPARCAIVIQPLYDLTKDKLDRSLLNQFRIRAIESILDVDQSRWQDLTSPIARAIEVADEIRVNNWIRRYQSVDNREFSDFLGPLLVLKTGIAPAINRPAEIKKLLSEFRLSYQNKVLKPILDRNEAVEKISLQAQQAVALPSNDAPPELIARIALAANVSLAMANAARGDGRGFAELDDLLDAGIPELTQLVPLGVDPEMERGPATTTPSASENRQKAELVAKLAEFRKMSSASRQTAIGQLGRLAARFEQISYAEAAVIADYMLSSMPLDEWLNVEKNLATLRKWPNLALAIADRLPDSNVNLDQALTIYRLMFDDEITLPGGTDWKTEIASRIISSTFETLQRTTATDFSDQSADWRRLQIYLTRIHEARYQLIREYLSSPDVPDVTNAGSVKKRLWALRSLELLMNHRSTGRREAEQISRLLTEILQSGRNELEQTVLANQTLFEILADQMMREFPDGKLNIEQVRSDLRSAAANSEGTGQRLLVSELALLQLWDILRTENIKLLYHRS